MHLRQFSRIGTLFVGTASCVIGGNAGVFGTCGVGSAMFHHQRLQSGMTGIYMLTNPSGARFSEDMLDVFA